MKRFNGEPNRKARYLRLVIQTAGMTHITATFADISFSADHRRWLKTDPTYKRAFDFAVSEGRRRFEQHVFNILCDAVRKGYSQSEQWFAERFGDKAISTIKKGHYPRWK